MRIALEQWDLNIKPAKSRGLSKVKAVENARQRLGDGAAGA
jgi:hypothetical protein